MMEYISREAVIDLITRRYENPEICTQEINNIPAADAVPVVHARWEECDYLEPCVHGFGTIRHFNAGVRCTNCVNVFDKKLLWKNNFCPNCGAKMDGGKTDEN